MGTARVHHASSRSRSVFCSAEGVPNPGRSEAYFSHHRSHQTLTKVETLETLTRVTKIDAATVRGYGDRDKYAGRTSSRSDSANSNSEKELGEISSGEMSEEFFDFNGEVKNSQDLSNKRKRSWNNEIEVKKLGDSSNRRKYLWNNVIGDDERASMLLEDECEPGQIQESPAEEKPLRNIAASRWADDDDDDDFYSPNPKRVKVSSNPGKKISPNPTVKLSPDISVRLSSDASGKLSSNCTSVKPFSSPSVKISLDTRAKFFSDTVGRLSLDMGARITSESSVKLSPNAIGSETLVPESPDLYAKEEPLVNIAASRWADDEDIENPNLKRAKISSDSGFGGSRDWKKIKLSANNNGGERLLPENRDLAREISDGSGVSSVCSDSDGSRHSSERLQRGESGVSDDEQDLKIGVLEDEHDLRIVVSDDERNLKIAVSDDEHDQMDTNGENDPAESDPNEVLPSELESPLLSPPLALAVRKIDMMQGCRNVDEFERLNKINEGTYGIVYRARNKKTGEIVALKKVKMEREREGFPMSALREINVLLSLQHPSVVNVKEVVVGSSLDNIFMVMEYMEHDLKDFIGMMKQPFSTSEVKCLIMQLLEGVDYLHDNWVLHRDLKTSNLLINNKGELKICDFGLARQYGSPLKTYTQLVVTLWYRAPELLLGAKKYSTAVDMWSVGCIMAELLAKEPLFSGKSEIDQLDKIFRTLGTPNQKIWPEFVNLSGAKCRFVKQPYNRLRERFPAASFTGKTTLSESGFDLLNRLLTYDPNKRITAEEALNHEWFREVPLPKSKEFMPTYPTRSDHDRQSRRLRKSPDPLERLGKEPQQDIVSDESPRLHFNTSTSIGRTVLKCFDISCTSQAGLSDQVFSGGYLQPGELCTRYVYD